MVAEPRKHSQPEKIVRHWLTNGPLITLYTPDIPIHYGYSQLSGVPQIVIAHVAGLDDDALIQHTVWGKDKESNLQLVINLIELYEEVANYNSPFGVFVGAVPVNYTWLPDENQSKYILDIRVTTVYNN